MGRKTVAIIGARLSSSRLPGKQLLDLAGRPLIAHIVTRLQQISDVSEIIVATTNEEVNRPLIEWAKSAGVIAFDWSGDQNDVVGRVDAAFKASGADRFVYVCGDCPFIEPLTIGKLIKASEDAGQGGIALLEPAKNGASFIHEGFDVFNRQFWDRMVAVAHEPFEREHIGAVYFHLSKTEPDKIVRVDEDPVFAEVSHRLSVDTPQDYTFARSLYNEWYAHNAETSIVDLRWVITKLQTEPELMTINAHVHQKTVKETSISVGIFCEAGPKVGMGHLSRACVVANSLQAHLGAAVTLYIKGEEIEFSALANLPHEWVPGFENVQFHGDCLVCDVKEVDESLHRQLLSTNGHMYRVAIDQVPVPELDIDLLWVPSVHLPGEADPAQLAYDVKFGAHCFLLRSILPVKHLEARKAKQLVVLTGGSDPLGLSKTLPQKLDRKLERDVEITWVQGPYAKGPNGPVTERLKSVLSPPNLHQFVSEFDAALCVYGVTFFECLQAQVPVVTFDPIGAATEKEWALLQELAPQLMAENEDHAIEDISSILAGGSDLELPAFSRELAEGPRNFADAVRKGVGIMKESSDAAA